MNNTTRDMKRWKGLIRTLTDRSAPSGAESGLQNILLDQVRDVADEVWTDTLGNAVARKHGAGPHILISAHADEPGVMVIHIDEQGFLRLIPVGDTRPDLLVGRHVRFVNGVTGVIGCESDVKPQDLAFANLYVDIGADSQAAAQQRVHIGLEGVVGDELTELTDSRLAGRGLDNRVGCAIAIEVFRAAALADRNVSVAFTAQQTVGARGAKTAAYQLQPDLAFVIDAAPAGDMPRAKRMDLKLGGGPAIKVVDGTAIIPVSIKNLLQDAAEAAGIPVQFEVWPGGLSDAGAVQLSAGGVPVGGVSYPARYVGGPSTVVDLNDAEHAARLLIQAIAMASETRA